VVKSSVSICKLISSCSFSMAWIAAASSKRQIRTVTPSVSTQNLFRILGSRNSEARRMDEAEIAVGSVVTYKDLRWLRRHLAL
jgi:hypothetical protein